VPVPYKTNKSLYTFKANPVYRSNHQWSCH